MITGKLSNALIIMALLVCCSSLLAQQREVITFTEGWKFSRGENENAYLSEFDDTKWQTVNVPHDWAIAGPFDKEIDKQVVKIEQNNEEAATEKTGRTGSLPFIGTGWYRRSFDIPKSFSGRKALLTFDGAMSNAQVYVNGTLVGGRPYGYSYFYFDITSYIKPGSKNMVAVKLENQSFSSRWYPGAGLYRKVQLILKNETSFKQWGHFITTPFVSDTMARVHIASKVSGEKVRVEVAIKDKDGNLVSRSSSGVLYGDTFETDIPVPNPKLWDTEHPNLYSAELRLYSGQELKDLETITFGIRSISYTAENGFQLNGKTTKFKGVCLHHDLGPLGAAINLSALRRQLTILKDMGCNAIRSSHNMPSLEQLELCDEMGFMFLAESFDEWKKPKVQNGYHQYFDEWAEKDVVNLVHATRNHPCVVMYSSGNEVPDQWGNEGVKRAKWLQEIFHREDPTRPVTVGMDQVKAVMESGFGALMDVPGLNYRVHLYEEAYEKFPQGFILGSETASTVSSRGVYKFPVEKAQGKTYPDHQCSSYDLEYCSWSNLPEDDFVLQDDKPWVIGEFVWTGFDYLGEPTPYDNFWPSRSSYFGICDLAGLPKDRYYLYRSRWNTKENTLHILPHWNWEGREGETTPVFVYTNYPSAELFVNGKSMGKKAKVKDGDSKQERYRLMWMNVTYEPGTLKVVAYDHAGKAVEEKEIHTAGKPDHLILEPDTTHLKANGEDISFVTVTVVDKDGNPCPVAQNQLNFKVSGKGIFKAVCNGDATSLESFVEPTMKVFNGKLVVLVQAGKEHGDITLTVTGKGLKKGEVSLTAE